MLVGAILKLIQRGHSLEDIWALNKDIWALNQTRCTKYIQIKRTGRNPV